MISCPPLTRQTAAKSSKTRAFVLRRKETATVSDRHVRSHLLSVRNQMWDTEFASRVFWNESTCEVCNAEHPGDFDSPRIMQLSPILTLHKTCKNWNCKIYLRKSKQTSLGKAEHTSLGQLVLESPYKPRGTQAYTSRDHCTPPISLHRNAALFLWPRFQWLHL